jgi:hypothetical protein
MMQQQQLSLRMTYRAEQANAAFYAITRAQAKALALHFGSVTMDQIRDWAEANDVQPVTSPAAWGNVIRPGDGWVVIDWVPSTRLSNKGRFIRRWKWVGQA